MMNNLSNINSNNLHNSKDFFFPNTNPTNNNHNLSDQMFSDMAIIKEVEEKDFTYLPPETKHNVNDSYPNNSNIISNLNTINSQNNFSTLNNNISNISNSNNDSLTNLLLEKKSNIQLYSSELCQHIYQNDYYKALKLIHCPSSAYQFKNPTIKLSLVKLYCFDLIANEEHFNLTQVLGYLYALLSENGSYDCSEKKFEIILKLSNFQGVFKSRFYRLFRLEYYQKNLISLINHESELRVQQLVNQATTYFEDPNNFCAEKLFYLEENLVLNNMEVEIACFITSFFENLDLTTDFDEYAINAQLKYNFNNKDDLERLEKGVEKFFAFDIAAGNIALENIASKKLNNIEFNNNSNTSNSNINPNTNNIASNNNNSNNYVNVFDYVNPNHQKEVDSLILGKNDFGINIKDNQCDVMKEKIKNQIEYKSETNTIQLGVINNYEICNKYKNKNNKNTSNNTSNNLYNSNLNVSTLIETENDNFSYIKSGETPSTNNYHYLKNNLMNGTAVPCNNKTDKNNYNSNNDLYSHNNKKNNSSKDVKIRTNSTLSLGNDSDNSYCCNVNSTINNKAKSRFNTSTLNSKHDMFLCTNKNNNINSGLNIANNNSSSFNEHYQNNNKQLFNSNKNYENNASRKYSQTTSLLNQDSIYNNTNTNQDANSLNKLLLNINENSFNIDKPILEDNKFTKNKNAKLSVLKKFNFKQVKRENIDKKVIRKFKKFLEEKFQDLSQLSDQSLTFSLSLIKNKVFPPLITDTGLSFKSFNTSYMIWFFSHKDAFIFYNEFIDINIIKCVELIVTTFNVTDKSEIVLIRNYLLSLGKIYSEFSSEQKEVLEKLINSNVVNDKNENNITEKYDMDNSNYFIENKVNETENHINNNNIQRLHNTNDMNLVNNYNINNQNIDNINKINTTNNQNFPYYKNDPNANTNADIMNNMNNMNSDYTENNNHYSNIFSSDINLINIPLFNSNMHNTNQNNTNVNTNYNFNINDIYNINSFQDETNKQEAISDFNDLNKRSSLTCCLKKQQCTINAFNTDFQQFDFQQEYNNIGGLKLRSSTELIDNKDYNQKTSIDNPIDDLINNNINRQSIKNSQTPIPSQNCAENSDICKAFDCYEADMDFNIEY